MKNWLVSDNSLKNLLLIDSKIPFKLILELCKKHTPLLNEVDDGWEVSTWSVINFSSYASCYTEVSTISDLNFNSASSLVSTLVDYTFDPQHTSVKEGANEVERYNSNDRGCCNGRITNIRRCINITLWFSMDVLGSTIIPNTVKKLAVTDLQRILNPLFITVDIFALSVPYLFNVCFFHKINDCIGQKIATMIHFIPLKHYKRHVLR